MIKMERGKRAKNFTPNEKMRFVELITRSKVLLSKSTDKYNGNSITIKDRERAWEKLAKDFNRGNETKRSLIALKKVWDNLRRDARMQSAKTRCEINKTGGTGDITENPLLLKVEAALGLSSSDQGNSYDSSAPQNVTNDDDISDPMGGEKYYEDNSWCDNSWKLHETSSFHEVSPSSRDLHPETIVMEEMSMPPPPPLQAAACFQGRRHFKRRLRMEKTKKESLFNDLQAVAVSKNVSEKIKNDILLENLEKVKEDRLFVEAQRERQTSFERAQREIQLDILKLERKAKEAILKKIQSGCRCYCATCRCNIIPPPQDDKGAS